ncbi:MAG: hypothetical protein JSU89_08955 [Myxococcales bacterium]|nr:MAG: hypothetical protein JSU89_08955 [Myxococcales bacterium]
MFGRTAVIGAAVLALSVLTASACSKSQTKTTIPVVWRNPDFTGEPFSNLFVMGVGRNADYRRLYEDNMVRALEGEGATAEASWVMFPDNDKLEAKNVFRAVSQGNFDAVVVARLLSVDDEVEYVPGKPPTSSDEYMSGYNEAYAVNSDPGYYRTNTKYSVETALYSIRDEMLVWVVRSQTVNPDSVGEVIQSVSSTIAKKMKADGLIR